MINIVLLLFAVLLLIPAAKRELKRRIRSPLSTQTPVKEIEMAK